MATPKPAPPQPENAALAFGRRNYLHLGIGIGALALGFLLMAGEPFIDATRFSRALWVSPLLILGGFAWIVYAILARPRA